MILADSEIKKAIECGDIVVDPYDPTMVGPNSIDVRLGDIVRVYNDITLDPKKENKVTTITIPESGLVLVPNRLYLATTVEKVCSRKYRPALEGKSSIARLGLTIHLTAGYGDVGFDGDSWTLEMFCLQQVRVYPNMPIGQIEFAMVHGEVEAPYNKRESSKYNGENKAQPSLYYKNKI
jgi:dCTP deaminase